VFANKENIMSTRTIKKLVLHRETLRTISGARLTGVYGGVHGDTAPCTITIYSRTCNTDACPGDARIQDHTINDTVYRPGNNGAPAQNDTVYHGGRGRAIPI
jgi:hypothetical protein